MYGKNTSRRMMFYLYAKINFIICPDKLVAVADRKTNAITTYKNGLVHEK